MADRAEPEVDGRPSITTGDLSNNVGVAIGERASSTVWQAARDINNFFVRQRVTDEERQEERGRNEVLRRVREHWIGGVLGGAAPTTRRLNLLKLASSERVFNPLAETQETHEPRAPAVPTSSPVADIFEENGGRLLILGAPGSGKTIALLEIASVAVAEAENDPNAPIPVVIHLASWTPASGTIADWIVGQIQRSYGTPPSLGQRWVDSDRLVMLLDGLDEVRPAYRRACVEAINKLHDQHGLARIAVCCRTGDYDEIGVKLWLLGAIVLQPLDAGLIEQYLAAVGEPNDALAQALQEHESLRALAQRPLMLRIMHRTFHGQAAPSTLADADGSGDPLRTSILDAYVRQVFAAPTGPREYSYQQSLRWLTWLAATMREHSPAQFSLEQLQPGWLPSRPQGWIYALGSRLIVGISLMPLLGFFAPIYIFAPDDQLAITRGVVVAVTCGLVGGIVLGLVDGFKVQSTIRKNVSSRPTLQRPITQRIASSVFASIVVWFACALLLLSIDTFMYHNALFVDTATGTSLHNILYIVANGAGPLFSIILVMRGVTLSAERDIYPTEAVRWSWLSSLRGAYVAFGLGVMMLSLLGPLGFLIGGGFNSSGGLPTAPSDLVDRLVSFWEWLTYEGQNRILISALGVIFICVLGAVIGGISHDAVDTRSDPNQGIRRSMMFAVVSGLLVMIVSGVTIYVVFGIVMHSDRRVHLLLNTSLWLSGAIAMWYGGLAVIQHFVLRALLCTQGCMPWRYVSFLSFIARLELLQQVGGAYKFQHALLQDYFADSYDRSRRPTDV